LFTEKKENNTLDLNVHTEKSQSEESLSLEEEEAK
jgi:hypothetical protein